MAFPNVDVEIQNGGLGQAVKPDDRVVALVINGDDWTPYQIFSLKDTEGQVSLGNELYAPEYFQQIADFYKVAGEGAELWVQPVAPTHTTAELFAPGGIIDKLLMAAEGRINVVGLSRFHHPDTTAIAGGLMMDTINAMDEAQALAENFAAKRMPVRFILDGREFPNNGTGVPDLKTNTYNRVAVCCSGVRASTKSSAMGLLMGRIASIPVQRNIGRVKDGSVPTSEAYMTSGQSIAAFGAYATALHDKGYILLRKFIGKAGFFWNDDHTATNDGPDEDFNHLATGRVIDKAARVIYATFVEEVLEEVPVDDKGKIVKTVLKQYQEKAERAIGLAMGATNEISFVECFIDPNQDILATSELLIDVRITPVGINRLIKITLGLFNPNVLE